MTAGSREFSPGQMSLLEDAKHDDVSFYWILEHLDLIPDGPIKDWRPPIPLIDAAFRSVAQLQDQGLVVVDVTSDGPPQEPYEHPEASLDDVRDHVIGVVAAAADAWDWQWACTLTSTPEGRTFTQ